MGQKKGFKPTELHCKNLSISAKKRFEKYKKYEEFWNCHNEDCKLIFSKKS